MSIRPLLLALGGLFWAFGHAPPRCDAGSLPNVGATSNVAADDVASSDEAEPTACYTLVAPGSAWRQLDPAELRALSPDALAGLAGPRGVRVFLHAGPNEHPELQTSLDEVLRAQQLEQSAVAFVEETEIGGRQALRGMINGRREGVWIRFHALVFREGPDLYRLTGWGRSETVPADGSTFEEASAGLRRLEGMTLDVLPRGGVAPDADGPGWRVRGGTYLDGALGFVLDPRGPWRVALGRELGPLARLTHVGLIDEQHDALFAVAVERNHGRDFAREEQLRRDALGDAFASGVLSISASGRKVDLRLATVPATFGTNDVTRQLAVGVLNEGDLTVLFVARHPAATAVNMVEPLQQALGSLRVLSEPQRQALSEQLASAPVALDAVGRGWCLRERIFTDFANGVRWRAPAGFWLVEGGDGGAAPEEGVLARIQERQSGLRGTLSARPAQGLASKAWHAAQVARRLMPRADGEPDITVELGNCTGSLSWGDLADDSGWRGVVATCVRGDVGFELVLRGPPQVLGGTSGTALSAVGALEIAATPIAPTEMLQGSYVDLRLGFSLASPDPTWSFKESKLDRFGPQAAAADGVVAGFDGGGGRGVYAAALWTAAAKETGDATPDSLLPSTLRSMADLPDREPDENIDATLRGRPSRLLTWNERGRRIEVALFTRGCTVFAVCAASVAGDPEPRQWLAGFQLLD